CDLGLAEIVRVENGGSGESWLPAAVKRLKDPGPERLFRIGWHLLHRVAIGDRERQVLRDCFGKVV
ncbi:hypothetical protein JW905_12220, partial [bacterium]|nr:hypothetical protein [candidate division CSSED10-310 bacterium]